MLYTETYIILHINYTSILKTADSCDCWIKKSGVYMLWEWVIGRNLHFYQVLQRLSLLFQTSLHARSLLLPGVLPAKSFLICSPALQPGHFHHYLGLVHEPWLGLHGNRVIKSNNYIKYLSLMARVVKKME